MRDLNRKIDKRKPKKRGRGARVLRWVAGALVVAMILVLTLVLLGRGGEQDSARVAPSGPQRVGPLEVSATRIDLGQVPLERWVNPTFRLRNVSVEPVTITIPMQGVETVQGCWPPFPVAGSATTGRRLTFNNMEGTPLPLPMSIGVAPGEELELRLELQMMAGMDGPHIFRLPVQVEGELLPLVLYVQGLFR